MHRAEARLTSAFPPGVPVPRLLDVHDDGDWVALVYEDVAGRHPSMPWRMDELEHVMDSLARLHEMLTPCPVPDLGRVIDDPGNISEFASWSRLCEGPGDGLDGWTRAHLDELAALESGWRPAAVGTKDPWLPSCRPSGNWATAPCAAPGCRPGAESRACICAERTLVSPGSRRYFNFPATGRSGSSRAVPPWYAR